MKNFILTLMILCGGLMAFADGESTDKKFTLRAQTAIVGNQMEVSVFLANIKDDGEALGNMNVRIQAEGESLPMDFSAITLTPGSEFQEFNGYEKAIAGFNSKRNMFTLNIYRDTENGSGVETSTEELMLGTFIVPLSSINSEMKLVWNIGDGDLTSFEGRTILAQEIDAKPIELNKTSTGIAQNSMAAGFNVNVFPNPVISKLGVSVSQNLKDVQVEVYSLEGKLLFEKSLDNLGAQNSFEIDAQSWTPGNYILRLRAEGVLRQKNIIKL